MTEQASQTSTILKKYLLKRQKIRDEPLPIPPNIFRMNSQANQMTDDHAELVKKYQTISTNMENSIAMQISNVQTVVLPTESSRQATQVGLPTISIALKPSQGDLSFSKTIDKQSSVVRRKPRQFTRHVSDPFYTKLEKTFCPKTLKKYSKFEKGWVKATQKRRGKSLIERSFNKATQIITAIHEDNDKRRRYPSFQEILRNNIEEKTFIYPSKPKRELRGLTGTGGKIIPMFQEVNIVEQVLKVDKGTQ